MRTKILIALMTLACLLVIEARAQVNYAVSGTTAYVTSSPNASGDIFIASTYNGYPVTAIGDSAFYNCRLTSVTIPDSVTSIGNGAISYCDGLTSVTIPNSVTNIGEAAFEVCINLTSVIIPDSVTGIGSAAFAACTSLTNLTVDPINPAYSSLDGVLFDKPQKTLVAFPAGHAGSYAIPNSVTGIGVEAFAGCTNLTSVSIPNSVTNVGDYAFYYCISLTSVIIPDSVTTIGEEAFSDCITLTNLAFLGNAPSLGSGFFNLAARAMVYYYYGTAGWGPSYGGLPAVMLGAPAPQISTATVGVKPGGFGFTLAGVTNQTIVVEASSNLMNWQPLWTNTLSGVSADFLDPQWSGYPRRFYRASTP